MHAHAQVRGVARLDELAALADGAKDGRYGLATLLKRLLRAHRAGVVGALAGAGQVGELGLGGAVGEERGDQLIRLVAALLELPVHLPEPEPREGRGRRRDDNGVVLHALGFHGGSIVNARDSLLERRMLEPALSGLREDAVTGCPVPGRPRPSARPCLARHRPCATEGASVVRASVRLLQLPPRRQTRWTVNASTCSARLDAFEDLNRGVEVLLGRAGGVGRLIAFLARAR